MQRRHWSAGAVGLFLALVSVWQIAGTARGLEITTVRSAAVPLTIVTPEEESQDARPLVLIGHGFAGSSVVMRGLALSLAHAGYTVALWDFDGHGANGRPLAAEARPDSLLANVEAALAEADVRGLVIPGRVAIVGHSMGSGVALAFGQTHPETAATVAVSPVSWTVTPTLPRNLLLLAGSREPRFVRNAEQLLAEAGGAGGDAATGTARKLLVIPGVEHISILFAPATHRAVREWLDGTFGPQPGAAVYTDRRVLWYGLGLLGTLLVGAALAGLVAEPDSPPYHPLWRRLGALVGGALGATLLLWLVGKAGLELRNLLGLLVGGYVMVWFGVAGSLGLLLLRARLELPSRRAAAGGMLAFGALWLGVGLMGQSVWLPWLLIPRRLLLWPLGGLLLLPWFLTVGEATGDAGAGGRIGWWLAHSGTLAGGLFLALRLSPGLGFLVIILPLFPIILGFHALAAGPCRKSWSFALSGALFVSWILLAVFPLQ
ncbi:MAG TPA: alpha/beta hydrolase [Thermoflexia bacterium]|nr:alpha/beta hydrolase [Thermoflexia bacterium]